MTPTVSSMAGFTPSVTIRSTNPERDKYRALWAKHPEYRNYSPAEKAGAAQFLAQAHPNAGETVIDFGCGTGRGAFYLALFGKLNVILVDFCDNCLDPEVSEALGTQNGVLKFVEADLTRPLPDTVRARYGFCVDMMEHVAPDTVKAVLSNVLAAAQHVYFHISTIPDDYGPKTVGGPLHLTIQPFSWWRDQLLAAGAVIHWSEEQKDLGASFYVSAWTDASELVKHGGLNTTPDDLRTNIRHSLTLGLPLVRPYDVQPDAVVMLLAGGPSLADHIDEIKAGRAAGNKLITVNGSYGWALAHGLQPSAQILVDARAFNSRFVQPASPNCRYLLASQCHPDTFAAAPKDATFLWHSAVDETMIKELDAHHQPRNETWFPILGGSTVVLRALTLLRVLGFKRIEIFGFDSCVRADQHHAYAQTENDGERLISVTCGNRVFACAAWMASQAQEFLDQIKAMGDEFELRVHGDGLIAHILQTGADLSDVQPKLST
jgi:SAM-dependent methyltransferase